MKFSIIVPVYNVEDYLDKCLSSIFSSSYDNYEVIIVNDGTEDNSEKIIKDYMKKHKNIIYIKQENQGLSEARNHGIKKATGDYIIFVDSDDYIEKDLLSEINKSTKNNPDLIRYQIKDVYNDKIIDYEEIPFENKSGVEAFDLITKYHYVENAWAYAYKRSYYLENNFEFKKGIYHEDFGIVPLIIIKANKVNSISYIGYDYYQRDNSIMNNNDYEKTKKKVEDFYNSYLYLIDEIDKLPINKRVFKSFISNSLIIKICELNNEDYKKYKKKLKKDKVFNNILSDTIGRKIKKIIVSISPKLYYKK